MAKRNVKVPGGKPKLSRYAAKRLRQESMPSLPPNAEPNAEKYGAAEAALIRGRRAPCLTCTCDETQRAFCEAW